MMSHLSDETLLLLSEGELSTREVARAEEHLATCAPCRERREMFAGVTQRLQEPVEVAPLPGGDAARERLVMAMQRSPSAWSMLWHGRGLWLRVGTVAALLLIAVTWRQAYRPLQDRMAAYEETGPEPNRALTPGSASPIAFAELCSLKDDDLDPAVSPEKQRAVFQAYGMGEEKARAYQVDYLINPQLGGNDTLENLWPEPYHATVWNASAKDALETKLHGMVCGQQISLEEAQHDLSTDWIAAYKKYFHTQRPVSNVAAVVRADLP